MTINAERFVAVYTQYFITNEQKNISSVFMPKYRTK